MRDFADVPNSVGSFPNVTAQDCSGPGETDGSALIADTSTDYWGAIQALLSEVGDSPNDTAESSSGTSQILNALKILSAKKVFDASCFQPTLDLTTGLPQWDRSPTSSQSHSRTNSGNTGLPIDPPRGFEQDITITVRINPGAARSGGSRTAVQVYYKEFTSAPVQIGSDVYDDGTTDEQSIVVNINSITPAADRAYFVIVRAGNDGATNYDTILGATVDYAVA